MKPSCKEIQQMILARQQGGALPSSEIEALEHHLAVCPACRSFERDVTRIFEGIEADSLPSLPDEFFLEMRRETLQALSNENTKNLPVRKRLSRFPWFPTLRWKRVLVPAFTGLCGLLLGFLLATARAPSRPTPTVARNLGIPVQTVSEPIESAALVDIFEDYAGPADLIVNMDDPSMEALISQWSDELPSSLLEDTSNETG